MWVLAGKLGRAPLPPAAQFDQLPAGSTCWVPPGSLPTESHPTPHTHTQGNPRERDCTSVWYQRKFWVGNTLLPPRTCSVNVQAVYREKDSLLPGGIPEKETAPLPHMGLTQEFFSQRGETPSPPPSHQPSCGCQAAEGRKRNWNESLSLTVRAELARCWDRQTREALLALG